MAAVGSRVSFTVGAVATADAFEPSPWLRNRHVQTVVGSIPMRTRLPDDVVEQRLVYALPDGDAVIARAWWQRGSRRAVLLVHGVGGSAESPYVVRAAHAFARAGCHVIRLNLRGAGEGVATASAIYHAGLTSDLDVVVRELAREHELYVVGFSLGGSLVLKLAGEWGGAPPPGVAAVATLSAPTDFNAVSDELERFATFPYRRYIVGGVIRQALAFADRHPQLARFDRAALLRARTIRQYDGIVMVPMHGFASVQHYYDSTTAAPWLPEIRIPTLLVHAEDDPIIPGPTVRASLRRASSAVRVAWTARGGHVGWVTGRGASETWAIRRLIDMVGGTS